MNVLILEDEPLSAERLERLLLSVQPSARVVAKLDTVEEGVRFLVRQAPPDLLLLDIHLADGSCFELFRQTTVTMPVIFTTAYDQYAIRAFKVNSVDYLLKPIDADELQSALVKFETWQQNYQQTIDEQLVSRLTEAVRGESSGYKTRFLVKFGDQLSYRTTDEISYFRADDKVVYLITTDARRFIVDYTLDDLADRLDPRQFFRLNRSMIAALSGIRRVRAGLGGRLEITIAPPPDEATFVSRDRASDFRRWLDGA
jgi:two-component system, LytTR family, response regulator LytT